MAYSHPDQIVNIFLGLLRSQRVQNETRSVIFHPHAYRKLFFIYLSCPLLPSLREGYQNRYAKQPGKPL
jgi:hypothetical protein